MVRQCRLEGLPESKPADTHSCLLLQIALDDNNTEWTFIIKSWPNGGENKRVYVMEKTGDFCCVPFAEVTVLHCLWHRHSTHGCSMCDARHDMLVIVVSCLFLQDAVSIKLGLLQHHTCDVTK